MPYGHEDVIRRAVADKNSGHFSDPGTEKIVELFTLPSGLCEIVGFFFYVSSGFSSTDGAATINISAGWDFGVSENILTPQNAKTTGAKTLFGSVPNAAFMVPTGGGPIYAKLTIGGGSALDTLITGFTTAYCAYIWHNY